MKKYAIVEVGSTNSKLYFCENKKVVESEIFTIEFKKNFKTNANKLLKSDVDALVNVVAAAEKKVGRVFVFGTSIFRELDEKQKSEFLSDFKTRTGVDFNVVSADEENQLTVLGVVGDIDYKGRLAVMIGGGGSTEIALVDNKRIIQMSNQKFGGLNILEKFPDLINDKPTCKFEDVEEFTKGLVKDLDFKADILVLAGGDFIKFYEKLKIKMEANKFYKDEKQPYVLSKKVMDEVDEDYFYNISLDAIRASVPDPKWWDGTRLMRFNVRAIFDKINAKYIVPTRISMVYGLIEKVCKSV